MSLVTYESTQLDEQRTFPRDVVKQSYFEQDGICAICGTRMPEFGEDIHGDHVLLYKDGNPTSPDNCDAVHASCNLRK
jgi:5-methylcytosine-specific restriction endonuclease McrA